MVKVNLQNEQPSETEEPNDVVNNEEVAVPEMPDESVPEPETYKKKSGVLKYILLIFVALIATGSAYILYTKGWTLKDISFESAKSLFIVDEASVDESPIKKTTAKKKPKAKKKLSTIKPRETGDKKVPPKSRPKQKPKSRGTRKVAKSSKRVVSTATDGRNLLQVLNSIVTSLGEESGDLKLTVSNSQITLAINLNSRADAALLLRKIRQKWPLSNLRAVRFEHSNNLSAYNYVTQFDGSVKPSLGGGNRRLMNLKDFKKLLSENLTISGLTSSNLEAKKGIKGKSGTIIPMVITADGANESIVLFMESLMKTDASYTVSRVSVLSKDDAVSKMSIYLSLNIGSDKARS